jgi:hypothetical protein
MKAAINKDGTLTVFAENETEYYALKHWFEAYTGNNGRAALGIDMEKPKQKPAASAGQKPKSTDDSEYEYIHISYRKDCPF